VSAGSGFGQLWRKYRHSAKLRKHAWSLTKDEFRGLVEAPCHFCGRDPSLVHRWRGSEYVFTGVDRWDNTRGYVAGNVVPCCATCNFLKGRLAGEEFLEAVARIVVAQVRKCERP
jgi:hypothetical protein